MAVAGQHQRLAAEYLRRLRFGSDAGKGHKQVVAVGHRLDGEILVLADQALDLRADRVMRRLHQHVVQHLVEGSDVQPAHLAAVDLGRGPALLVQPVPDVLLRQMLQVFEDDVLLHVEDGRAGKRTLLTFIALSRRRRRPAPNGGGGAVEEEDVFLDHPGVADEDALGARRQRAQRVQVSVATGDVVPEVVDAL